MNKSHGGLQPDAGKSVGSIDEKAVGSLEKNPPSEPPAEPEVEYSSYSDGYESSGSDGGSGGGSDGGSGGGSGGGSDSSEDSTADATEPDGGTEPPDDSLYVEEDGGEDVPVIDGLEDTETVEPPIQADPQPPNPNVVSIDVEAMTRLVAAMERAREQVAGLQGELHTILSGVHLDTSETSRFEQVAAWIADELPGLRRRLAMAQDLAGGGDGIHTLPDCRPQLPRPYVGDESQIITCPPHESYDNGRRAAQRFSVPRDQPATRELVAQLREGRHDPYYAREFAHTADPETLVRAILRDGDGGDGAGEDRELVELTASTVATAARGTGELAPPPGYEEQWAALRESDDPDVAAAAAQLRPG